MKTVHSKHELTFRCHHPHKPVAVRRKRDWGEVKSERRRVLTGCSRTGQRPAETAQFQTDCRSPGGEGRGHRIAQHNFCFEWQLLMQCSTELCSGYRFTNNKRPRSTHIHDIVVALFSCKNAWAKCSVPSDINAGRKTMRAISQIMRKKAHARYRCA